MSISVSSDTSLFRIAEILRTEGVSYSVAKTPAIKCDFNQQQLDYSFCYLTTSKAVYAECFLHDTLNGFDFMGTIVLGLDFNPNKYDPWHPRVPRK